MTRVRISKKEFHKVIKAIHKPVIPDFIEMTGEVVEEKINSDKLSQTVDEPTHHPLPPHPLLPLLRPQRSQGLRERQEVLSHLRLTNRMTPLRKIAQIYHDCRWALENVKYYLWARYMLKRKLWWNDEMRQKTEAFLKTSFRFWPRYQKLPWL